MKTLVLSSKDLLSLHDSKSLNQTMRSALMHLSERRAVNHQRHVVQIKPDVALGFMPADYCGDQLLGYKAVAVFANNRKHGLNPHQGLVVLLNSKNGAIRCLLEGSTITALRTAAVSAVATEKLSRPDSSTLALIGAGQQAVEHALAIVKVRPIRRINIFNRTKLQAEQLAQTNFKDFQILIASTPQVAVQDADIVVTSTASAEPLLSTDELNPGTHVNAIGSCRPGFREINIKNRHELKIYLDSTEACLREASEIIFPLAEGCLNADSIRGEIGACLNGKILGRVHDSEITLFKSVGLGVQDLFAAEYFFQEAQKRNLGTLVDFGVKYE